MQDRIPLYPGRVTLTPVSGQANTYDMTRADQPTEEGTPLNKNTLLKDATAALYGLGSDAVPDEVLGMLKNSVQLVPQSVTTTQHKALGDLSIGEEVLIEETPGESPVRYVVLHQGLPSDLYDASCNGTWMIRAKSIEPARNWNTAPGAVWYDTCDLNEYINGTFFQSLPLWIRNMVKPVRIPYSEYNNGWEIHSGAEGAQVNAFVLSAYEVTSTETLYTQDGSKLDFFDSDSYNNLGITNAIWSRSMYKNNTNSYAGAIQTNGSLTSYMITATSYTCPVMIFNSSVQVYVDEDGTLSQEEKYKTVYSIKDPKGEDVSLQVSDAINAVCVKLKEVVTTQTAQQVSVDVSDIDFDAYDEVIVYVEFENATASNSPHSYCHVFVNGVDDASGDRYGYNGDDRMNGTINVDGDFSYLAYITAVSDAKRYQCRPAKLRFQKRGQYLFCQSEFGYYQINSAQFYSRTEAGMFRLLDDPSVTSLQFSAGIPSDCTLKSGGKLRFLGVKK